MIKLFSGLLAAMLFASVANAQTTTQTSASGSSATAVVLSGAGGGSGPGGVGYLNTNTTGTVWTLGGTPSMGTAQYDACTKYFSMSAILAGVAVPLEIEQCWSMRMADAIAKYPPGSVQYNLLCNDSNVLQNDWDTGTMKCTKNIAKLPAGDPRKVSYQGVPVVAVQGHGAPSALMNRKAPPNGLALPPTNASVSQLPKCKGPTDQTRCYSG